MTTRDETRRSVRHVWLVLPATTEKHRSAAFAVFDDIRREFNGGFSWFDGGCRRPFHERDPVIGGTWFDAAKQAHDEDASIAVFVDLPWRVDAGQVAQSINLIVSEAHIEYLSHGVQQEEFYCAVQVGRRSFFMRAGDRLSPASVPDCE